MNNDHPSGLAGRTGEKLIVEGGDGQQIDYFRVNPVFLLQFRCGFEGWVQRRPIGNEGDIGTFTDNLRPAQRQCFLLLGNFLPESPIECLGFIEDHRVGVTNSAHQQGASISR